MYKSRPAPTKTFAMFIFLFYTVGGILFFGLFPTTFRPAAKSLVPAAQPATAPQFQRQGPQHLKGVRVHDPTAKPAPEKGSAPAKGALPARPRPASRGLVCPRPTAWSTPCERPACPPSVGRRLGGLVAARRLSARSGALARPSPGPRREAPRGHESREGLTSRTLDPETSRRRTTRAARPRPTALLARPQTQRLRRPTPPPTLSVANR